MGSLLFRLSGCYLRRTSPAAGILRTARFSTCCPSDESFTSSLPSRISPWLMLPPSKDGDGGDMLNNFYSLANNKVVSIGGGGGEVADDDTKLVGSSHGWLALFNARSLDLFLWNPVSRRRINLPPIHSLPIPAENLKAGFGCVAKVIVSSSPDAGGGGDCRVVMSYGSEDRLAFCCPGLSAEWTPIGASHHNDDDVGRKKKIARVYEDFAYSSRKNRLFCITQFEDLERWDLNDPHSPMIDCSNDYEDEEDEPELDVTNKSNSELDVTNRELQYLVVAEQSNEVYLVVRNIMERMGVDGSYVKRISYDDNPVCFSYDNHPGFENSYPYKTVGFDVYKIDDEKDGKLSLSYSSSLDGLVMFVGINHSFALPAADFPELKRDSIYFTDAKELTPCGGNYGYCGYGGHDLGIFNYENETFSPCYYPSDVRGITRITPAPSWFTPTRH